MDTLDEEDIRHVLYEEGEGGDEDKFKQAFLCFVGGGEFSQDVKEDKKEEEDESRETEGARFDSDLEVEVVEVDLAADGIEAFWNIF